MQTGRAWPRLLAAGTLVASLAVVTTTTTTGAAPAPPPTGEVVEAPRSVPGEYIVVLEDRVPRPEVAAVADDLAAEHDGEVLDTYRHAVRGFAAELSAEDAAALAADPDVVRVEENAIGETFTTQDVSDAGLWGLDRIDDATAPTRDNSYVYNAEGFGVNAYVLDTGIATTHTQFGVRASVVHDSVSPSLSEARSNGDCTPPPPPTPGNFPHGSFVAGVIGGTTTGVAKSVNLRGVRMARCNGSIVESEVLDAIDWVTTNAVDPAVVNASWGFSGADVPAVNDAVRASIASGLTWVVAAGNGGADQVGDDACSTSPAMVSQAIVVGATDIADARTGFSNFGPCLDLFAPGAAVRSAYPLDPSTTATASGTSFAAPFVAGVAARYLANNTTASPSRVALSILGNTTPDVVTGAGTGSPNRLLFSGFLDAIGGATASTVAPNDGFAFPTVISRSTGEITGRNFVATTELGEPVHRSGGGNNSVWYQWTAPSTGVMRFDTCDTGVDTVMAVYTGSALGSLTKLGDSDDSCPTGNGSRVSFVALQNTTYRIAVAGWGTASGHFNLAWGPSTLPGVVSLTPTAGPTTGGTSVTINGVGLSGATGVSFGGTASPSIVVNGPTQIVAQAPARSAGAVTVTVTTGVGTSPPGGVASFTYFPPPEVISLDPGLGSWAGGTAVTITGTGFNGASSVTFGGVPATSFTPVSDAQITAVAPSAAGPGPADVVVTGPGGPSTVVTAFLYTQPAPVVASRTPASGPPEGGTLVTINGTGLYGVTGVSFGGTPAGFTVLSDTQITATAPAHAVGTVDIVVTGPAGSAAPRSFSYQRPANNSFTSPRVLPRGNFDVTGSNVGANKQAGEPNHGLNIGGASVWYRWTPNRSGRVTIRTQDSTFDTLLAVYTGTRLNQLTVVRQNDDAPGFPPQSQVRFNAVAGRTYQIAVDGFDLGPAATGAIRLRGTFG